jgi:hypothetical protein
MRRDDDASCALNGDQTCIVNGLAATANSSGASSLEVLLKIDTRSWFAGSGKLKSRAVSSQNFAMRAERLVRLAPKKFQAACVVHHFADLGSVDILRTRFSSDPSIQKAGL